MNSANAYPKAGFSFPERRCVIVSCEHAGNRIPPSLRHLFEEAGMIPQTHHGYDIGALRLARCLSARLHTRLYYTTFSRLLIDVNRSLGHRNTFSEFTSGTDIHSRQRIIRRYYKPYRNVLEKQIGNACRTGRQVIHFSVHTFTPVLHGVVRDADMSLLYDPRRYMEKCLCHELIKMLQQQIPELHYRRNYPYRGTADGVTAALRKRYQENNYIGIEIEVNQKFPLEAREKWQILIDKISMTLADAILNKTDLP